MQLWVIMKIEGMIDEKWGIIMGLKVLRMRGDYIEIVKIELGEIISMVIIKWKEIKRGKLGI